MVEVRLPAIRQNLRLMPGSNDEDGAPRWLIHDVTRNRYFSLVRPALELVRHWQPGVTPEEMSQKLSEQGLSYEAGEIRAFADFLIANNLVLARSREASDYFYRQQLESRKSIWSWLLHNYLFVRIPLIKPDPFLSRLVPRLGWLFSGVVHKTVLLLGLVGVFLVLRQWDKFAGTLLDFFNLEGLLVYAVTLIFVKSAHELGHAVVSRRLGCRVASMGVAFLVMFPVLYTDTTDAWKLRSRRKRLRIVTAGVRTELYLALLATFAWAVLPDGTLRTAAFFLATTSWVTSLLVNISPFLRFDGYYAFSDLIGVENLQQRAFALGRWRLRHWLWGIDDPMPEPLPRSRARLLVFYAWFTWLYRFFLFLGIALLVYKFFFKALGILLFIVEILWFIVMPFIKELKVWRQRWSDTRFTTGRLLCWSVLFIAALALLLPLPSKVSAPAVIRAETSQYVFTPESGRVAEIYRAAGDSVSTGDVLLQIESPELNSLILQTRKELDLAELRLGRLASSAEYKAEQTINQERVKQLQTSMARLNKRAESLVLIAPVSGVVAEMQNLQPGQWIGEQQYLLTIVNQESLRVEGFISEQSLKLIAEGDEGVFISDSGQGAALPVRLEQIDVSAIGALPYPELSSSAGGDMAVRQSGEKLIPEVAHYRLGLSLGAAPDVDAEMLRQPGTLILNGKPRSWLLHQGERFISLAIRESGF
ncbi:HlyD family efflux transporter periplasmic adaptor subunit [Stutzerimonas kunmingensis]|uniref:HlyD family efflux transporter periplasmic adaptor subunit n=1 Tax=Stutzerimonas kunmingensis TaxID=1211807 RepID=UPI0028A5ACA0|nr:HlyD family efflux transporter periplasmic adaptor subunit [Stutzerimonas kunmingensis]